MERYLGQLKEDSSLFQSLKDSNMTKGEEKESRMRAGILESLNEHLKEKKKWIEAVTDRRDAVQKLVGCQKCKDRWENPHRSYGDSEIAAFIDKDKIG